MDVTEGNRQLASWLARSDTPSQRALARRLPRITQPMLSRHAKEGVPSLRTIFVYQVLAGIPPEAWLTAADQGVVDVVQAEFGATSRGKPEPARVARQIAVARHALMSYMRRCPPGARSRLASAMRSLVTAESDVTQAGQLQAA